MQQTLTFSAGIGTPSPPARLAGSHLREPETRTMRYIGIGLLLSLCLHILFFVVMPARKQIDGSPMRATQGPLVVQLNPSAGSPPPVAVTPPPTPAPVRPAPRSPARPSPAPPMMTIPSPLPQSTPLVPEPVRPVQTPEAAPTDFMSMINAKREQRAAAEAAARAGRGNEPSADDIAAANLNRNLRTLSQRDGTSGVFQILSKGHRAGQFSFRGWTNDASNSRRDVIDVDAGLNGNIELAIVRRMIELIRTHYQGNFNWESHRLGRVVVLSARVEDNAGLEEFLMREFFR
jgi:hypothetical protein